jgi:putative flippase GtrA
MSRVEKLDRLAGRPLRFMAVGGLNTAAGLAVIYAARYGFGFGDVAANMIGYACGLAISFVLNARWTFRYRDRGLPALLRFLVAFLIAYGMNLICLLLLLRVVGTPGVVAQAASIVPYTIIFYLLSRHFAFRQAEPGLALGART